MNPLSAILGALAFLSRLFTMAFDFIGWRRKVSEGKHAQAVADTPKTTDELMDALDRGEV